MMGITLEELKKLDKDTYSIIDIRDESDIDSGAMPGAICVHAEDIYYTVGILVKLL